VWYGGERAADADAIGPAHRVLSGANCRDFSTRRLALQLTPLRSRGPIKTFFAGKPHGLDREAYYCSELVVEPASMQGSWMPPRPVPRRPTRATSSSATGINLYLHLHLPAMNKAWDPPARWTGKPDRRRGEVKPGRPSGVNTPEWR